jgi:hypothetical protein
MDYTNFEKMLLLGVTDLEEIQTIKRALKTLMSGGPESFPGALNVIQGRVLKIQLDIASKIETPQEEREKRDKLLNYLHSFDTLWKPSLEAMLSETKNTFLNVRKLRIFRLIYALIFTLLIGIILGGYGIYRVMDLTKNEKEWLELQKVLTKNDIAIVAGENNTRDFFEIQIASMKPFIGTKRWKVTEEVFGLNVFMGKPNTESELPQN